MRERIVFALYIIALAAIIGADALYEGPLFQTNLDIVPAWQHDMSDASITYFKLITLLGYGAVGVGIFMLTFIFFSREKAFYILFVHTLESLANQLLKMLYQAPRPYFMSENMEIYGSCAMTYGNPSGHSSFSTAIFVTLFLLIFHDEDYTLKERLADNYEGVDNRDSGSNSIVMDNNYKSVLTPQRLRANKLFYFVGLFITFFLWVNIGVSRFMLGAHSLDQVLYGWTLGLWFAFFLFRYVRPTLQRHVRR